MFRHKTDTKTLHSHELTCDTLGRAGQTRLTCAPEWDRGSVLAPWTRWLPSSTSFAPPPPPDCFTLQLLGNIHLLLPPPRKGYLCSDSDLCRKGGLCQSSGVKNCAAVQRKTSRTSLHHRESCGRLRLELLIVATACVVP